MEYLWREAAESELVCVARLQNTHADVGAEAIRGVVDTGNREQMASEVSASKDALIATLCGRLSKAEERAAWWEATAKLALGIANKPQEE